MTTERKPKASGKPKAAASAPAAKTLRVTIVEGAVLLHEGGTYHSGAELVVTQQAARSLREQGVAVITDTILKEAARPKASRCRENPSAG